MTHETVGYVRLEWTCPNCGTRNPGPQKKCASCGAAQPANVRFEQTAEEKLITDQAEIARAQAGPDVQCPYCGTRNPAAAKVCSQCGGDLAGGVARASGAVLGAHRAGPAAPVACPACGAQNPATAFKCAQCGASLGKAQPPKPTAGAQGKAPGSRLGLILATLGLLALLACCFFAVILPRLAPAKEVTGQVTALSWTRSIAIEQLGPVSHEGWRDEIPAHAAIGNCTRRLHHTQQEPAAGARKVCGTPYTVDRGNGYGEVVQDCEYEVYADWCQYTVEEWQEVDEASVSGHDSSPQWPALHLGSGQREGERLEAYEVTFEVDKEEYVYRTRDATQFARCQIGSRWVLRARGSRVESIALAK